MNRVLGRASLSAASLTLFAFCTTSSTVSVQARPAPDTAQSQSTRASFKASDTVGVVAEEVSHASGSLSTSQSIGMPAKPALLSLSYPSVTGRQWIVNDGDNLQTALNKARRGDEVVLQAGATFTGNFVLPVKSGTASNGWIVVRSAQLSALPTGTRVTPAQAGLMPKVVTPNVMAALTTAAGRRIRWRECRVTWCWSAATCTACRRRRRSAASG